MTSNVPYFTPWREEGPRLEARHVGRHDVEGVLRRGLAGLAEGRRPTPVFLFGPRGVGKSHLLARLHHEASHVPDLTVSVVPEDRPPAQTADDLWAMAEAGADPRPTWARWGLEPPPPLPPEAATLVIFDGLGAQLDGLSEPERRAFRAKLVERPCTRIEIS